MILFAVISNAGKSRKKAAGQSRPVQDAQSSRLAQAVKAADAARARKAAQAAKQARTAKAAQPVAEAKLKDLRFTPMAAPEEGRAMLDDDDCHGGSMEHVHTEGVSRLEDADCAGGSMEHTHTEGVSRAELARRMAAIDEAGRADDMLPERIDARALRRAVVMAEVLGKPRALKKSRFAA